MGVMRNWSPSDPGPTPDTQLSEAETKDAVETVDRFILESGSCHVWNLWRTVLAELDRLSDVLRVRAESLQLTENLRVEGVLRIADLEAELSRLRAELHTAHVEAEGQEAENDALRAAVDGLEVTVDDYVSTLKGLRAQVENLRRTSTKNQLSRDECEVLDKAANQLDKAMLTEEERKAGCVVATAADLRRISRRIVAGSQP